MKNQIFLILALVFGISDLVGQCDFVTHHPFTTPSSVEISHRSLVTTPFCNQVIPERWIAVGAVATGTTCAGVRITKLDENGQYDAMQNFSTALGNSPYATSLNIVRGFTVPIINPNGTVTLQDFGEFYNPITPYGDGVSVIDIFAVQSHILGTIPFTGSWQFVAADVNNDAFIDVGDIVGIRRFLLFSDNRSLHISWEYVETESLARFDFSTPNTFATDFSLVDFNADTQLGTTENLRLTGVKIGDLNADNSFYGATSCLTSPTVGVSRAKSADIEIKVDDKFVNRGDNVEVLFSFPSKEYFDISAIGLALNVNSDLLKVNAVTSDNLNIDNSVFIDNDNKEVKVLWVDFLDGYVENQSEETYDITLNVKALDNMNISDAITLNQSSTLQSSIVYANSETNVFTEENLVLDWNQYVTEDAIVEARIVGQNPFIDYLAFNITNLPSPRTLPVEGVLYDYIGRVVKRVTSSNLESANMMVEFSDLENLAEGVYIYKIIVDDHYSFQGKVIKAY